ncbi:hypothetical protein HPP92_025736 [Vanilla planifolia]|uniref:Uncharacterized protein n=1 Tax=Vanilla planifolia TaxID=51239 RepID=A0A835UAG8_VANPL|nr:hypothetical protein HPP92_025736 [Vanilla planifolia]
MVTMTGPLGCVPAGARTPGSRNGDCAAELLRAADLFNPQLEQILRDLNDELGADVFIAANAFRMHMDFVSNPTAYGKTFHPKAGKLRFSFLGFDVAETTFDLLQVLLHQRSHAVARDLTMGSVSAPWHPICAQIETSMLSGMHSIHRSEPTASL